VPGEWRKGSSYCSQSETVPSFGFGQDKVVQSLKIEWPSGTKQKFANVPTKIWTNKSNSP
jgi:ASPIC and UnbV